MNNFDAIVVGSGHNGLTCAAYLAKAGLKTLVVERRTVVGGATVTEEIWPGYKISRASYVPNLRLEVIEDLELPKFGLKLGAIEPINFMPFPDGKYFFRYTSHEQTAKEIERFSKKDAKKYLEFSELATKFVELVETLILVPPPPMGELLSLMKGTEVEEVVRTILMTSSRDLLDEFFESEYVKAELCMHAILNTSLGPDTIGSSYILANVIGSRGGYNYAVGGTGAVAEALASCFRSHNGLIRTNAEVKKIIINDSKARGIEIATGEKIFAKMVVSNADPKHTFLKLVGRDNLDKGFANKVEHLSCRGTSFKINIALNEPMDFKTLPGTKLGPQHKALTDICPTIDYAQKAYDECKWGRMPKEPPLDIFSQTAWDLSSAPPGKQTLSIIAKYNPYHLASGNPKEWEQLREKAQENALSVLENYVTNLRGSILEIESLSPLDMEVIFGLTEGNVTHIDQSLNQMLSFRPVVGWSGYRTPIGGLYLCGAGSHPGGGVTGAPGHNAARVVLEDAQLIKTT